MVKQPALRVLSTPILSARTPSAMRAEQARDYRCLLPSENDSIQQAAKIFFDEFYRNSAAVNALKALQNYRDNSADKTGVNTTILFSLISIQESNTLLCLISFSSIYQDRAKISTNNNYSDSSKSANELARACYSEIEHVIHLLNTKAKKTITFQLVDRANNDINRLLVGAEKALHGEHVSDLSVRAESGRRCAERSLLSELMIKNELYGSVSVIGSQAYSFAINRETCKSISACDMCVKQALAFYALIRLAKISYCHSHFLEDYALANHTRCEQMLMPFKIELQMMTLITESLVERINMIKEFYSQIDKHWPNASKKTVDHILSLIIREMREIVLEVERYFNQVYKKCNIPVVSDRVTNTQLPSSPIQFFQQNTAQNKQAALTAYQNAELCVREILRIINLLKEKTSKHMASAAQNIQPTLEEEVRKAINTELVKDDLGGALQQLCENFERGIHCYMKSPADITSARFGKNLQDALDRACKNTPLIIMSDATSIKDFHKQLLNAVKALSELSEHIQTQINHCQDAMSGAPLRLLLF